MTVSILVPFRPDGGHRERTWDWLARRYAALLPEMEVIIEADDGGANPGEFNHPLAINRAAHRATGSVFVVADCDTAFEPGWVRSAAEFVAIGSARWVLPTQYVKVTEADSAGIIAGDPTATIDRPAAEWIGESVAWSGLVVIPRAAFELVGGYDERFAYWGADDSSFGLCLDTVHGPHTRHAGAVFHLWHPAPLGETYGHDRHREQHALNERYQAAAGDAAAMWKVRSS